jgi:hypothetical protein
VSALREFVEADRLSDKTETVPTQVFEALGFQWDCRGESSPRCRLPGPKVKALRRIVALQASRSEMSPDITQAIIRHRCGHGCRRAGYPGGSSAWKQCL